MKNAIVATYTYTSYSNDGKNVEYTRTETLHIEPEGREARLAQSLEALGSRRNPRFAKVALALRECLGRFFRPTECGPHLLVFPSAFTVGGVRVSFR